MRSRLTSAADGRQRTVCARPSVRRSRRLEVAKRRPLRRTSTRSERALELLTTTRTAMPFVRSACTLSVEASSRICTEGSAGGGGGGGGAPGPTVTVPTATAGGPVGCSKVLRTV